MQQGPEADTNRVLAGAEHWVRLDGASSAAQPSGERPGQLDPAGEGPLVMVAGWEDGHPACAPFVAADGGEACRGCPVALVAGVLRSGRAATDRCPYGIRMLAFPAPAGSRDAVGVLRLGTPESSEADLPSGRAILRAARRLRTVDGLMAWQAEQRARGAERRRTAAAALAQMIATTEEFHRLWTAADRDRVSVENSMSRLDTLARETLRESEESRVGVAHSLHDNAAQSMVSAHRFLEAARASLAGPRPEAAGRHLDAAQERLLAAIKEIRTVLNNLVPPGLEELGLADLVGKPRLEVISALADLFAGDGSSLEDAAARNALIEVLNEVLPEGDITDLELDAAGVVEIISLHLALWIYFLQDTWIADRIAKRAEPTEKERLDREIRSFLVNSVKLELEGRDVLAIQWRTEEGRAEFEGIAARVFRDLEAAVE